MDDTYLWEDVCRPAMKVGGGCGGTFDDILQDGVGG